MNLPDLEALGEWGDRVVAALLAMTIREGEFPTVIASTAQQCVAISHVQSAALHRQKERAHCDHSLESISFADGHKQSLWTPYTSHPNASFLEKRSRDSSACGLGKTHEETNAEKALCV
jgi:hypothetical protein